MRLGARAYPEGDATRDAGQARLLSRLQARLPAGGRLRIEVGLGIPGDVRAWDAEISLGRDHCPVEAGRPSGTCRRPIDGSPSRWPQPE
jgi:hypothetical protein